MADLYRCKTKGKPRWRYGEGLRRPVSMLTARGIYNSSYFYPKGSPERAQKIAEVGFVCERLQGGDWIDVTREFL